ncbi:MAG: glycosyltransferase family 4 protein [Pseudomonadales bacterium]|nr:glycosyltransferase family 4 protein [Pseudomonadales bacterium]
MSQRILQICPHDISPFGELCRRYELAAASLGIEMTTVFLGASEGTTEVPERVSYLNLEDLADTAAIRRALAGFSAEKWTMVICHRYRPYWAIARSPLAHNLCVVVAHEFGMMSRRQRRWNRRLFASRMHFAGVSPDVAAELLLKPKHEPIVLPNVLDVPGSAAALLSRADALAALGLPEGPLTVGVVGRIHYKKRPKLSAEAFARFSQQNAGSRLVFLGGGDTRELPQADNIFYLGQVPQAQNYFQAFDVLLHPVQVEAFGMVVLEAMYAGVPVVTLPQGGPKYVLGELGVYASEDSPQGFADALARAVKLDRDELLHQGRLRVDQHFSIASLARSLDHVLTVYRHR